MKVRDIEIEDPEDVDGLNDRFVIVLSRVEANELCRRIKYLTSVFGSGMDDRLWYLERIITQAMEREKEDCRG